MHQRSPKSSFRYIAFEGIDGSGKTTQAKRFYSYLQNLGYNIFYTKEPGGVEGSLRELILNYKWNKKSELFLFLADRALNAEIIKRKIDAGYIVVSDRSMYSTLAYQGFGEGLNLDFLIELNMFATGGLKPDVVFCFDIDLNTMKDRVKNPDVIELKSREFFDRVRRGYISLAETEENFFLIDGSKTEDEVFEEVKRIWESL